MRYVYYQRFYSSVFHQLSIYLSASTNNGVVWLPITLQQFNALFGTGIGCSIQPG
jgi:hypothetical protein